MSEDSQCESDATRDKELSRYLSAKRRGIPAPRRGPFGAGTTLSVVIGTLSVPHIKHSLLECFIFKI